MDRWNRIAGLNRVLRAVESAGVIGRGVYHDSYGNPCCAIGHALGPVDYDTDEMDPIDAAAMLRVSDDDVREIITANDCTESGIEARRRNVLSMCRILIRNAVRS